MAETQPASIYNIRFLEAAWKQRATFEKLERKGLFATSIVVFQSTLEATAVECLQYILKFNDCWLYNNVSNANYQRNYFGENVEIGLNSEYQLILRLKSELDAQLEYASFSKIKELHKRIVGNSVSDHVGSDLNRAWTALAKFRNVIAHGRKLKCNRDWDKTPSVTFENLPLHDVENFLRHRGLFNEPSDTYNSFDLILNEDVVRSFLDAAERIKMKYTEAFGDVFEKFRVMLPPLPKLDG